MSAQKLLVERKRFLEMPGERQPASSRRILRLGEKFRDKRYRDSYVATHVRQFLAQQMRALRGSISQTDFGRVLDKPQSVVSRLEDPSYGKWTLQTLLDVAAKLERAVIVRIVDFPTFLRFTEDVSEAAIHPLAYGERAHVDLSIGRAQPIERTAQAQPSLSGKPRPYLVEHFEQRVTEMPSMMARGRDHEEFALQRDPLTGKPIREAALGSALH
jgi:hypothetical protein